MKNPTPYLARELPSSLSGLATLALDLRWSWNHGADALWHKIDTELWDATRNPWLILESVSERRLKELASDSGFLRQLDHQLQARSAYLEEQTWFSAQSRSSELKRVAYFSMEFGLSEALPIYAGGLGVLAGDCLKCASDLGLPLVGVGLLYQQGYFRQMLDARGEQQVSFPYNDPVLMPVVPLRDADGEWVHVRIELPGRRLVVRAWEVQVGRVRLLLLDSNDPRNRPNDRGIISELYGGGPHTRLQQEILLGIGGWRLLEALGLSCDVFHLNEGHAAFAVLERARAYMLRKGCAFAQALCCTRAGNIFTTHTPVAAGFDRFSPELMEQYFKDYADQLGIGIDGLLALGRAGREPSESFNMAYLAMRGSAYANGVSRLHAQVSRRIFQPLFDRWPEAEVPVGHVTNGVHMRSWDSAQADELWTEACGKNRWVVAPEKLAHDLDCVSDVTLWKMRTQSRAALVAAIRARLARQQNQFASPAVLNEHTLTLGFARRFVGYKRPNLLLQNPDRLARLVSDPHRPLQVIVAGKAHPQDEEGARLIRQWTEFICRSDMRGQVVFVEDYDLALAADLVAGVDLWVNTPRRPWEASGTSGMKVLVNGGLNLSELDGWWAEAASPEVGWSLGDGLEHDSGDTGWDQHEAEELYRLIEQEVVPAFYDRDASGIPKAWVRRMRQSMALLTPRFSANRMMREYMERYYAPAARGVRERTGAGEGTGAALSRWLQKLAQGWGRVRLSELSGRLAPGGYEFTVEVFLGDLSPDDVAVELYADAAGRAPPERHLMSVSKRSMKPGGSCLYRAAIASDRPVDHYSARVMASHPAARVPMEASFILWTR
jgi:starch phosphorylase